MEIFCGHAGIWSIGTFCITGMRPAGCSKRLSSKAAASEEARRTLRYVEPLNEARTKLAAFFSILLEGKGQLKMPQEVSNRRHCRVRSTSGISRNPAHRSHQLL